MPDPGTRVQSVILDKGRFPTRARAEKWIRDHDFRADRLDETAGAYRFRQLHPSQARAGSFRNIRLDPGVRAVVCRPRTEPKQPKVEIATPDKLTRLDAMVASGELDFTTLTVHPELLELRESGKNSKLGAADRRDMLEAVRAGKVVELVMSVVAFQQPKDKPRPLPASQRKLANSNFVTFRDSDMPRLARSFVGRPFLADHNRRELAAKGGKIIESDLVESKGRLEIHQSVSLVKPWAVEAALDGTLDSFSIGWDPAKAGLQALQESIICTVDNKPMFSLDCPHFPGEVAKVANEKSTPDSVLVEAEFRNPRGAELSGVVFPAVTGTRVETITAS